MIYSLVFRNQIVMNESYSIVSFRIFQPILREYNNE
ncbi:hypothetical protein cu0531 [Corynebacterium urealyticum DSM 7109]|uniref:Uncharacterized protein n=1 Tax=Corynebacterium urealyticum (strain ATCC 43042 / DSM 7109) TaxID=504474 RepID=B1VFF2_CORU7|nr:hypothetical protein cu0531 [Corynebacterium urealyticum DSM 7109]